MTLTINSRTMVLLQNLLAFCCHCFFKQKLKEIKWKRRFKDLPLQLKILKKTLWVFGTGKLPSRLILATLVNKPVKEPVFVNKLAIFYSYQQDFVNLLITLNQSMVDFSQTVTVVELLPPLNFRFLWESKTCQNQIFLSYYGVVLGKWSGELNSPAPTASQANGECCFLCNQQIWWYTNAFQ